MRGTAKFLILDEATSQVDSETEKAIQEMLAEKRKEFGFSIIAIAHRLFGTVAKCHFYCNFIILAKIASKFFGLPAQVLLHKI